MANIKKNAQGYGYKYTDLAAINDYIESIGETYYQEIERIEGDDYVITVRQKDGKEIYRMRGARVVQASLSGKTNAAQEQGSGLTYARRYSLLMAYGLATEDDDGETFTQKPKTPPVIRNRVEEAKGGAEPFGDETLTQAKLDINAELVTQGYRDAADKKSFIKFAIGKETIDSLEDARAVAESLDNQE